MTFPAAGETELEIILFREWRPAVTPSAAVWSGADGLLVHQPCPRGRTPFVGALSGRPWPRPPWPPPRREMSRVDRDPASGYLGPSTRRDEPFSGVERSLESSNSCLSGPIVPRGRLRPALGEGATPDSSAWPSTVGLWLSRSSHKTTSRRPGTEERRQAELFDDSIVVSALDYRYPRETAPGIATEEDSRRARKSIRV